jgi:hypothetical protein
MWYLSNDNSWASFIRLDSCVHLFLNDAFSYCKSKFLLHLYLINFYFIDWNENSYFNVVFKVNYKSWTLVSRQYNFWLFVTCIKCLVRQWYSQWKAKYTIFRQMEFFSQSEMDKIKLQTREQVAMLWDSEYLP